MDQRTFVKFLLLKNRERFYFLVWYFYGTWWVGGGWLMGETRIWGQRPNQWKTGSGWKVLKHPFGSNSGAPRSFLLLFGLRPQWIEMSVCIPSWLPSYLEVLSEDTQYGQGGEKSKELVHEKPWGNLKCALQSMRSQSEKTTMYCMIPAPQHAGEGRTMGTVKRSAVGRG